MLVHVVSETLSFGCFECGCMSNIRALDLHLIKGNFSWCLLCFESILRGLNNRCCELPGFPSSFVLFLLGVLKQPKWFLICDHVKCSFLVICPDWFLLLWVVLSLSILAVSWECYQSDPNLMFYALHLFFIQAFLRESDASAVVKTSHCLENGDSVNLWKALLSHIPRLRDDNQLHVLMWMCWLTVIIGVCVCVFGIVGHTHSSAIMSRSGEGELPGCSVLASLCPVLKRTVDAMLSNFPGFVTICSEQDVMSLCKQIVLFAYLLFTGTPKWHEQVLLSLLFRREDVDLILSLYCTYSHVWCFDDHNQTFLNLSGPKKFLKYQTKQHLQTNDCKNFSETFLQLLLTSWFQSDCHFYFGEKKKYY